VSALPEAPNTHALAPIRRRILLSAFACSPLWGSEPGVGWQWLLQLARQHEVVLITHPYFRGGIEPALRSAGLRVEVHYVQAPAAGLHPHRQLGSRAYYTWWQWRVRTVARRLLDQRRFDLIHHLTWGTLRFPCFLGGLGVPLVMGPLGGGESAPLCLLQGLPLRCRIFDYFRALSLLWVRIDPLATWGPRQSALVLCRTKESLRCLPKSVQERAVVVADIGSPQVDLSQRRSAAACDENRSSRPYRLLFAGRLLGWKGVALAVGAVAHLVASGREIELDIAGDGPLRGFLIKSISELGLSQRVRLLGNIPRDQLLELYAQADLFVFPSLHDAGGTVVLEALSRGLPVVCLDLGGPPNFIDGTCGAVVATRARSRLEVELAVADAIARIISEPGALARLSVGAVKRAQERSWENLVRGAYVVVHRQLGWLSVKA